MAEKDKNWDGKSRGGRSGYLIFAFAIKHMGLGIAYFMLAFVVPYFILFAPKATKASWQYHRRILHQGFFRCLWELYAHYFSFGTAIIDRMTMKAGQKDKYRFEYDNYDKALEIVNRSTGAIFIGAHMGSWEVASYFFGKYGKKASVVMWRAENEEIQKVIDGMSDASALPFNPIVVNDDPIAAMIAIKAALNDGGFVCFDGDRYLDINSTVRKPFLGGEVLIPEGPFRIAAKCRVPVVFFYAMREPHRTFRFIFEEAPQEKSRSSSDLIDAFLDSLGNNIARYPRQWFNFYNFWNL